MIDGLDWIHANHDTISAPAVINISGTYAGTPGLAFQEAVVALLDDVGPVIVAAGNNGEDACDYYPAGMSDSTSVITVAASDSLDARLEWGGEFANLNSNWGNCVTVFAPGEFILTANQGGPSATIARSGTSLAAPHVTGIAAIYLENNPTATPAQVRNAIVDLATTGVLSNVAGSPNKLAFTPQPVSAFVDGQWAPAPGSPIWQSNPGGGDLANYTFLWSRRLHYSWGSGSWVNVGTSETVQLFLDANHPNFTLRVVVTSAGYEATDSMYVFGPCNKWGECP